MGGGARAHASSAFRDARVSATVSIRLRDATALDVDAIARIEALAFTDPWSRASFASLLGSPHVVFLVAEQSTAPAFSDAPGARGRPYFRPRGSTSPRREAL